MKAVWKSNYTLVKQLLDGGADPNKLELFKETPLWDATLKDDTIMMGILLSHGANIHYSSPTLGSLLDVCAEKSRISAAQFLLSHGLHPNEKDPTGQTPLMVSASLGNPQMVRYFLSEGANPNFRAFGGNTALETAVSRHKIPDDADTTVKIINHIMHMSLNGTIPDDNYLQIIADLLSAGAYPSAVIDSESGYTPLHQAAADGDTAVVRLLLKFNADRNAKDKEGMTPLDVAKSKNCKPVEAILAEKK